MDELRVEDSQKVQKEVMKTDDSGASHKSDGTPEVSAEEEPISGDMDKAYESSYTLGDVDDGMIIQGRVVQINEQEVLLDIGYKSEGVLPLSEIRSTPGGGIGLAVGDEIEVYVTKAETQEGMVLVSKRRADEIRAWDAIRRAYGKDGTVRGVVVKRTKGGLTVDVGVEAFLPASHVDLRMVNDFDRYIGEEHDFKVIRYSRRRGNVVVSRRAVLEEAEKKKKETTLATLEEGSLVSGVVKSITNFGAFVDIGGMDALLHINDMSWKRLKHPSDILQVGDKIEAKVLSFNRKDEKVSLGLKQKTSDPWTTIVDKYPVGSTVKGRVTSVMNYGAFVELEEGVEGLVHVSEMSWSKGMKHPSKIVTTGDVIEAAVLRVDPEAKRISLGIKQVQTNPWLAIDERYPVGSRMSGRVVKLTDFGAFVRLEDGIDGLVHISDMSWVGRIQHPKEVVSKGQEIEVVVLSIDKENERISLGLKQTQPDPWSKVGKKYKTGSVVTGKVSGLIESGAFMEIEPGIEGFVHISQLDRKHVEKPDDVVQVDSTITATITKINKKRRKIDLSVRKHQEDLEQEEMGKYLNQGNDASVHLGDLFGHVLQEAKAELDK
jgi:small subunit ribosomal protein S1